MVTQKVSYLKVIKISLQCQAKSFLLLIFQVFIQIGSRRKVIFALQYSGITHKGVLVTLVSKGQNWQYLRNYPNISHFALYHTLFNDITQWNCLIIYFFLKMGKDHFKVEAVMYINTHATSG